MAQEGTSAVEGLSLESGMKPELLEPPPPPPVACCLLTDGRPVIGQGRISETHTDICQREP